MGGFGGYGKGYGGKGWGGYGGYGGYGGFGQMPMWGAPMMPFGKGKGKGKGLKGIKDELKVWVGELPEDLKWKDLQTHMNQAGDTKWVEVFSGKGKGTAGVAYKNAEDAAKAVATLSGSAVGGGTIVVDSWVRAPKEEKA
eukprot:TRINITY_DN1446_c0_g1_i1.p1 TRINITY_DN1446_c0_g1~~TRINITY_DN1446_c0_g1_i1.p1  ORF type:complete len:140 (-),score=44.97 TRINITY_DN1446_c0_g1_i1:109-528(-)